MNDITTIAASALFPIFTAVLAVIKERSVKEHNEKTEMIIESLTNQTANINTLDDSKNFDAIVEQLIQGHHKQALQQASIQFWFSLAAAVAGFGIIIATLFFNQTATWYESLIKTLPGIIIEAVSALFFTQSKETRQQSSDFLNRLRQDRQYEKSIDIADTIPDEQLKAKLKAEIALHLCGINKSPNEL